jgi:uncharacterized repeat protein (TIGR01451 family)
MNAMKLQINYKSMLTAAIFCLLMLGTKTQVSAQFLGAYFFGDSTNFCVNTPGNAYAGWNGAAGTYVTGDTMEVDINWGDGNTDYYPVNIITVSGGTAYIPGINATHTYTTAGTFYVTVTAHDHYGYSNAINDSVMVVNYCGYTEGYVLYDDGDAVFEWGTDITANGVPLILTTSINTYGGNTDVWGHYNITNVDQNATTYHLEVDPAWLTANGFTVVNPAIGYYDFTTPPVNFNSYNFLLNCGGTFNDASVSGYGWGFMPAQNSGTLYIWLSNFSCSGTPANIDLSIDFDPMLTVASSTLAGYTVTGNTFNATVNGVNNYGFATINFGVPAGTPPFTPLVFDANINVTNYSDTYLANNHYIINSEVRNSWDPNDKSTNVAENIDANTTEEIYYTIRFQNMGNADATTVTIKDTLDSQFDIASFRLEAQSHAGSYSLNPTTRELVFTFPNIMLPPQSVDDAGSQGFVRYRITENTGLGIGTELNNTAYIYFDSNPAIITNTTSNINTSLGVENEEAGSQVIIYPQPATSLFYIGGIPTEEVKTVSILDANGKIIQTVQASKLADGINISQLSSGMYFVNIETTQSSFTKKLCVQH